FENRNQHFLRGAGIGRALEDDQLPGAQVRRNRVSRVGDVTEIRLVILVERSWYADDDGIHRGQLRVIRGSRKAGRTRWLDLRLLNPKDVRSAGVESFHLALVDVEASHSKFLIGVKQSQGQSHVSQANDAYASSSSFNRGLELKGRSRGSKLTHNLADS